MNQKKNITFEEKIASLEKIVREMELGSTPLDESLEAFEKGVSLVKECNKILESATQRVDIIKQSGIEEESDKIE